MYAFMEAAPDHALYRGWLQAALVSDEPVGVSELVLSGFVRVVTHPRVFDPPAATELALAFANALLAQPMAIIVRPTERHWQIFDRLCLAVSAKGNLVPDAYLAALVIDSGGMLVTTDRDFSRFPGLRWRHPLSQT